MWSNMLRTVKNYIEQHQLLTYEGRYLIALSGGADSVALLLIMKQLGYAVEAVHCNFQLRGTESQRDEDFVRILCTECDTVLHLVHFDTRTYAQLHKVSIEMAARQLRYHYFEQLRQDLNFTDICVAHHQDDSVETILMNLIRGTGIHGLTGIQPRQGHIVRPMLCVSRHEIEAWLNTQHQPYVTDSSNLVADVWRNKLRLDVVPRLQAITPQATHNILHTADLLAQTALLTDHALKAALGRLVSANNFVSISQLLNEPSPQSLLFAWLEPHGFTSRTIMHIAAQLSTAKTGDTWASGSHEICVDRGRLLLQPREELRPTLHIPEPGTYVYENTSRLQVTLTDDIHISRSPNIATLNADCVVFPLTLRPVQTADRFTPLGMKHGSRLVSDFLTDQKVSLFDKRRQLVLTDSSGHIVWLVGRRPDHHFRIVEDTAHVLVITFQD